MRLFIAEKPSLGRAIAAELGVTQNNPTFQICGSDTVTWCFGHILEQYDPQDYDDNLRIWRRRDLPIIPKEWKLRPKESALTQLQVINHLLSEAEMVVHAETRIGKASFLSMKSSNTFITPALSSVSGLPPSIPCLSKRLWQR